MGFHSGSKNWLSSVVEFHQTLGQGGDCSHLFCSKKRKERNQSLWTKIVSSWPCRDCSTQRCQSLPWVSFWEHKRHTVYPPGVAVLCYWGKNLESQRFVYRATQALLLVYKHYKDKISLYWALILPQEKHLLPNQTRVLTRWTIKVEMRNLGTESPSLSSKACRIPH